MLTVKEAAVDLGVGAETVRRLCRTGQLKHIKVTSRLIRIRECDLSEFKKLKEVQNEGVHIIGSVSAAHRG